jgi:hypothetical protein
MTQEAEREEAKRLEDEDKEAARREEERKAGRQNRSIIRYDASVKSQHSPKPQKVNHKRI